MIIENFEIDLKYGSYLFISNGIFSLFLTFLALFFFRNDFSFQLILIFIFSVQFVYFYVKTIIENNKIQKLEIFNKVIIFFRVFGIYLIFISLFNQSNQLINNNYFLQNRNKKISELLVNEGDLKDNKSNLVIDFIKNLKQMFT